MRRRKRCPPRSPAATQAEESNSFSLAPGAADTRPRTHSLKQRSRPLPRRRSQRPSRRRPAMDEALREIYARETARPRGHRPRLPRARGAAPRAARSCPRRFTAPAIRSRGQLEDGAGAPRHPPRGAARSLAAPRLQQRHRPARRRPDTARPTAWGRWNRWPRTSMSPRATSSTTGSCSSADRGRASARCKDRGGFTRRCRRADAGACRAACGRAAAEPIAAEAPPEEEVQEPLDFDPEVAAIFTDEATELIDASERALSDWRDKPGSAGVAQPRSSGRCIR